jgi:hypothetical protein
MTDMNFVRLPTVIAVSTMSFEGAVYEPPLCWLAEELFDCSIDNDLEI